MKLKKLVIPFISILMFGILSMIAAAVNPTVTLELPAASDTVTGTYVLNMSISNHDGATANGLFNVTFNASCTDTANTTSATIATNTNANFTTFENRSNASFDSLASLEDSASCTFSVTVRNESTVGSDTSTSVIVDNTVPQAATSLSPADQTRDVDGSVIFSGTVVGANTTSCTLHFVDLHPGTNPQTMTHSGDSCTLTVEGMPDASYSWFIRASDGTNTSDSAQVQSIVDKPGGNLGKAFVVQQQQESQKGGISKGVIAIIIIVGLLLYNNSKKK